jgi:hypothetical protein
MLSLLIFIYSCNSKNDKTAVVEGIEFESLFSFKQSVNIPATDSTIISVAITGFADDSVITVASGANPPIVQVNYQNGKIYSYNAFGGGPFELSSVFQVNPGFAGETYALDLSQSKILVLDKKLNAKREFKIEFRSFKLFTTDNDGNIYGLSNQRSDTTAVIKYDKEGNLIKKWGEFTPSRILQERTNGGGIVSDNNYIYYSYLGGHEIWKYDFDGNLVAVFDQEPDYFIKIDYKKLPNLSSQALHNVFANSCRMFALFYLEPGYIVQEFTLPSPQEEETKAYLEVWDTGGNKIAGNIEVPKPRILASFDSSLVVVDDTKIPEEGNPVFEIYNFNPAGKIDR